MWFLERLYGDLQGVLQDPQAAAGPKIYLLIGIAVLVVLVLLSVFLVLLAYAGSRDDDEEEESEGSGEHCETENAGERVGARGRSLPLWLSTMLVTLVVAGIFIGATETASRSQFCGRCHEVLPAVESWKEVGHAGAECLDCHGSPGLPGYVATGLGGLQNLVTHMEARVRAAAPATGGEAVAEAASEVTAAPASAGSFPDDVVVSASVDNDRCLACHEEVEEVTLQTERLRVRHSDFLALGVSCTWCHASVGHGEEEVQGSRGAITMGKCLDCHEGVKAPSSCDTCHLTDIGQVKMPPRYPKARIADSTTCEGCHSLERCTRCHGMTMPHPPGFASPEQHAREAAFERKENLCLRCHELAFCGQCHKVNASAESQRNWGHSAGWETRHQQGQATDCARCHNVETDMCVICHD